MEDLRLGEESIFRLDAVRIRHAAVDRAYRGALLLIKMTDAFRALFGDTLIGVVEIGIVHTYDHVI